VSDDPLLNETDDLWVFGYGSLMWNPGFAHVQSQTAFVHGFHRSLCVYSHVHRGTEARPGLVLGLDRGGSCRGMAFRVEADKRRETIAYLRKREQVTMVYKEVVRVVRLDSTGEAVKALIYVVDRAHPQYAGRLPLPEQWALVAQGRGQSGPNGEYVANTVAAIERMGFRDPALHWLCEKLRDATPSP
jgi:cation transport protein ChaC